ncbi:MAG: hypothetical protein MJ016_07955 [Victivallaceae bacterium]|nr:hypothetical protein [Victivallaceae bacterium]
MAATSEKRISSPLKADVGSRAKILKASPATSSYFSTGTLVAMIRGGVTSAGFEDCENKISSKNLSNGGQQVESHNKKIGKKIKNKIVPQIPQKIFPPMVFPVVLPIAKSSSFRTSKNLLPRR